MFRKWLIEGLAQKGKSQRGLAKHLGVHESVVSRIVAGTRPMRDIEIEQIAVYLGTRAPSPGTPDRNKITEDGLIWVEVTVVSMEGAWIDPGQHMTKPTLLPVLPHPRLRNAKLYGVHLIDASTRDGKSVYAICARLEDLHRPVTVNDEVHAVITRSGLEQHMIRRIGEKNGVLFLEPPQEAPPGTKSLSLSDVKIVGIVIGQYAQNAL